jgi:hypothetical protein
VSAAAALGSDVELVELARLEADDWDGLSAIVVLGQSTAASSADSGSALSGRPDQQRPLTVVLLPDVPVAEQVRILFAREADLVLTAHTSGRVVLETILALLRWRDR